MKFRATLRPCNFELDRSMELEASRLSKDLYELPDTIGTIRKFTSRFISSDDGDKFITLEFDTDAGTCRVLGVGSE